MPSLWLWSVLELKYNTETLYGLLLKKKKEKKKLLIVKVYLCAEILEFSCLCIRCWKKKRRRERTQVTRALMSLNIQQVPPLFPSSPLPEGSHLTTLQLLSQQIELQYHLALLYMYKMLCALSYILVLGFFSSWRWWSQMFTPVHCYYFWVQSSHSGRWALWGEPEWAACSLVLT